MHLKVSSAKCRPFCLCLMVLSPSLYPAIGPVMCSNIAGVITSYCGVNLLWDVIGAAADT